MPLVALAAIPFFAPGDRALQIACVLYALAAFGAFLVHTPFGGNTVRLGQLVGGPLVLCAVLAHGRRAGCAGARARRVLLAVLLWWQWAPILREYDKVADDPSTQASFYEPLVDFLDAQPGPRPRGSRSRSCARSGSRTTSPRSTRAARGWLRQVDVKLNPLFYDGDLTPERYRRWLRRERRALGRRARRADRLRRQATRSS